MKTIILLFAAAVSLAAQCGKTVVNPITGKTDCIGGTAVSGVQTGTGAPSAGTCAALANVGKVYVRKDTKASNASLYVCSQTGDGTFGWELGANGADGAGLAGAGTYAEMGASSPSAGDVWVLTDASSPGVCSAGSGTSKSLCVYTGSAWTHSSGMIAGGAAGQVPFQTAEGVTGFDTGLNYNYDTDSLGVDGKVTVGKTGTATGQIYFNGTTSGTVTVKTADAAGTWTLTLPANDGDNLQVLQTNGSGVTSWAALPTVTGSSVLKGSSGNAVAAAASDVAALFSGSGDYLKSDGSKGTPSATAMTLPYGCAVGDPAGSALSTGVLCYIVVPMAGTITGWDIVVDSGTATIDVWKVAAGTAKPTDTNSITASAVPAIASGTAIESTTLTDWTTSVTAGDILGFNLDAAGPKYITVNVRIAH